MPYNNCFCSSAVLTLTIVVFVVALLLGHSKIFCDDDDDDDDDDDGEDKMACLFIKNCLTIKLISYVLYPRC